ncbi:MAG: T9SS type A sorting domain-containing protein [Flavobacteriales bacterium]
MLLLIVMAPAHAQTIWDSGSLSFSHTSSGMEEDMMTPLTSLTRGNVGPLYNSVCEGFPGAPSCVWDGPCNTEWALGSISDWNTLTYVTWLAVTNCGPPGLVGNTYVCHLIAEDIYVEVTWTNWGAGGTGTFAYTRTTGTALPCGPGFYENNGGCSPCPPGSYCPDGITALPCPAGRYQDQWGQISCVECDAGYFNPSIGATSCQACPAGSFSAITGSVACVDCEAGFYNPLEGATSCLACAEGTYSNVTGSEVCLACEAGYYNPVTAATECLACPAGEYSAQTGSIVCLLCEANTYNPVEAATSCLACPNGETSGMGAVACVPDGGCEDVFLELTTDGSASETSWEVIPDGGGPALCSGSGYADNDQVTETCCLPNGCYRLRVLDSFGDGMSNPGGGYVLRDVNGKRIIDNTDGGAGFTSVSALANDQVFCLPLGTDQVIGAHCDRMDFLPTDFLIASPNPAVSAQFGVNNANSGYQFWLFDPNGTYSRRVFFSHANPMVGSPPGAQAAAHLRFGNLITNPVPLDLMLNVRIRGRVNGTYNAFGPTCRVMVVSSLPACPTTQLVDDLNNPNHSCGVDRTFGGSDKVVAYPVAGANQYRFRFEQIGDNFVRNITSPTNARLLNWVTSPLVAGASYNVFVQTSFDGGATWCPFGDPCQVDILNPGPSAICGNGIVEPGEECDDGNLMNGDGCNQSCVAEIGACCLPDGSCVMVDGGNCSAVGGTYEGDGTDCATVSCPAAPTCTDGIQNGDEEGVDCGGSCPLSCEAAALHRSMAQASKVQLHPNPNRGDQFQLTIEDLPEEVLTADVDIHDLFGKRVAARTYPAQGGVLNTVVDLDGQLAAGMYLVSITAGDQHFTERLVIE